MVGVEDEVSELFHLRSFRNLPSFVGGSVLLSWKRTDFRGRQVVKDTLNLPDEVLDNLPKYKPYLISGPTNLTDTNYTKPF